MRDSRCPLCKLAAREQALQNSLDRRVECERCGTFDISGDIPLMEIEEFTDPNGNRVRDRVHVLSGLTRQESDVGRRILIAPDNIISLLESVSVPKTPLENMERALLYLSSRQRRADDEPHVFYDKEYPLVFVRDGKEFHYIMDCLVDRGYLHERSR
jgi:hypothetical protein